MEASNNSRFNSILFRDPSSFVLLIHSTRHVLRWAVCVIVVVVVVYGFDKPSNEYSDAEDGNDQHDC